MSLVINAPLDTCNEWCVELWCKFHSRYADKLVVGVDNFEKQDLSEETYSILKKYDVDFFDIGFKWYEGKVWKLLLNRVLEYKPDWIGVIAVDSIFEDKFFEQKDDLFSNKSNVWYSFPIYHFWGGFEYYRVDSMWSVSTDMGISCFYRPCFKEYSFADKEMHSMHIPGEIMATKETRSQIRLKHYGFAKTGLEDYKEKCRARGTSYGDENMNFGEVEVKKWIE
ncbi:MAG: hypothetical protein HQ538_06445 [Parcubacteria group bacterium]|nr:hypothetical protein [Parcubacteria group bacterium]